MTKTLEPIESAATRGARESAYRALGIDPDPHNRNLDGSDYHLMDAVDAVDARLEREAAANDLLPPIPLASGCLATYATCVARKGEPPCPGCTWARADMPEQSIPICPFCGGGETRIDESHLSPTMKGPGALIAVTIRHWCNRKPDGNKGFPPGVLQSYREVRARTPEDAYREYARRESWPPVPMAPNGECTGRGPCLYPSCRGECGRNTPCETPRDYEPSPQ